MRHYLSKYKIFLQGLYQNSFDKLVHIQENHPHRVIGKSIENRNIKAHNIGGGSYAVLFLACTHGNEVGTRKLLHKVYLYLHKNINNFPKLKLFFVPVLNPDGYQLALESPDYINGGRIGRFNARDVDLNRNFPTSDFKSAGVWSYGPNYSLKRKVYCGENPGSEPETKVLLNLIQSEKIKFIFSYHSAGSDFVTTQDKQAKTIGEIYKRYSGFKWQSEHHWQKLSQTGTLKKWCEENKVSLIEIENPTRFGSSWKTQRQAIIQSLHKLNNS